MTYTVKQLAELANVSVRTLHYYDEIDLLHPSWVGENGYRYYADEAVLRLQQLLFFRELDFSLDAVKAILDRPDFDVVAALHAHRNALRAKVGRLETLINTIDSTILHMTGEVSMSQKHLFAGFSDEDEARYAREARELYGAQGVDESYQRWNSYTPQQKDDIKVEGGAIYQDLAVAMDTGHASPEVQAVIARWHQHLRHFYEPSKERLLGLGQLYVEHPEFARNFRQIHPDLPEFMREAIAHYCQGLR
jgi:DNA-binding transcriptional MerR regulator